MDYKKMYEEAFEKAKMSYHTGDYDKDTLEMLEIIFPKLKESEDERIRKMLIEQMKRWHECALKDNVIQDIKDSADAITWLEKQKEQSVILHKFNTGDWIVSKWGGIYQIKEVMSGSYNLLCTNNAEEINSITQVDNNSRLLCMSDIKKLEKQGEQEFSDKIDPKGYVLW